MRCEILTSGLYWNAAGVERMWCFWGLTELRGQGGKRKLLKPRFHHFVESMFSLLCVDSAEVLCLRLGSLPPSIPSPHRHGDRSLQGRKVLLQSTGAIESAEFKGKYHCQTSLPGSHHSCKAFTGKNKNTKKPTTINVPWRYRQLWDCQWSMDYGLVTMGLGIYERFNYLCCIALLSLMATAGGAKHERSSESWLLVIARVACLGLKQDWTRA